MGGGHSDDCKCVLDIKRREALAVNELSKSKNYYARVYNQVEARMVSLRSRIKQRPAVAGMHRRRYLCACLYQGREWTH